MSATHLGFFNTSSTRTHVRFQFGTFAAAGGNVAPASAFEAADIRIYKATDGAAFSATQRSSSNGITMTSPFDSLTGFHDVDIDLTDNTDAGFYASGCFYSVVLSPDSETIDSQTITGKVLAYFEIGVSKADVTQWLGTAVSTPTVAGVPNVNCKTWNDLATVALPLVPTTAGRTLDVSAGGEAGVDWANVGTPGSTVNLSATTVNLVNTITTYTGNTVQTGDSFAIVNSGTFGNSALKTLIDTVDDFLDTEIAAIKAKTDNLPSDPADASDIAASFSTVNSTLSTIADYIDTEMATVVTATSAASIRSAVGLASANLDTQLDALPTNAELATAITTGLTTALTEGYRSTNATGSVRDLLYEMLAFLTQFSITATTYSSKKLDGTTSAKVYTLNDATNPTAITETS